MTPEEKLLRFDRVCRVLWPAVRFFGLCGADQQYVEAVVELSDLLGIGSASSPQAAESIRAAASDDAVHAVADWVRSNADFRKQIGGRLCGEIANEIAKLKIVAAARDSERPPLDSMGIDRPGA